MRACWKHTPPGPYQRTDKQRDGNGYFHCVRCTHRRLDFEETRLREGKTIPSVSPCNYMDWSHDSRGFTLLEFNILAVPTDGAAYQRAGRRANDSSIKAKWRAQLEYELQRAQMRGIFDQIYDDSDEFPYNNLSIFPRNKNICQELNLREKKRKWEAEQDEETWARLVQRRAVLVDRHDESTGINTQRPNEESK